MDLSKDRIEYPLFDRGLVLLRGTNKDGGSDSNGTGKSSLAMAALWGLTGSIDPRLVNDAKVADVVTDGCKSTKVVIQGKLNGEHFRITRTKTSSKSGLVFVLGESDLTAQSIAETQEIMEEMLGIDLQVLSRTVFHGQHAVNGLLEATDVKFKDELALIVPIERWQRAASLSRSKGRNAAKEVTELNGMIKLRNEDLKALRVQRDQALEKTKTLRLAVAQAQQSANVKFSLLSSSSGQYDVDSIEREVAELNQEMSNLQKEVNEQKQARDAELQKLTQVFDVESRRTIEAKTAVHEAQRELDRTSIKLEMADSSLQSIAEKWNIDLSSGTTPVLKVEKCPTCLRTLSDNGDGHSHEEFNKVFKSETDTAFDDARIASNAKEVAAKAFAKANVVLEECERRLSSALENVNRMKTDLATKISKTEALLEKARFRHAICSGQLAEAFSDLKSSSEVQTIKAALQADEWMLQSAEERYMLLESDLSRAKERVKEMNKQAEEQQLLASTLSTLAEAFGAKGVQNFVLQHAIEALQMISQAYLDELSDGSLRLAFSLDAGDRIHRRAFVRLPDGEFAERPLSSLSGGQWRRCALALSFGFVDLISRRGTPAPVTASNG